MWPQPGFSPVALQLKTQQTIQFFNFQLYLYRVKSQLKLSLDDFHVEQVETELCIYRDPTIPSVSSLLADRYMKQAN